MENQESLKEVAAQLRSILQSRQQMLGLSFKEEGHIYTMCNKAGQLKEDFPSVSSIVSRYSKPFESEIQAERKAIKNIATNFPDLSNSEKMIKIALEKQNLLKTWNETGVQAAQFGSMIHNLLESEAIGLFGLEKQASKVEYICKQEHEKKRDAMVEAGIKFLQEQKRDGMMLVDTEIVLGDPEYGFVGQPDKVWIKQKDGSTLPKLIITDWKTNRPEKFAPNPYAKMLEPFEANDDNAIAHYSIQLSLYAKLLLKMLGENCSLVDPVVECIIVSLRDDKSFKMYQVDSDFLEKINQCIDSGSL